MTGFLALPRDNLLAYVARQLDGLFPDGDKNVAACIDAVLDEAVDRLCFCASRTRYWRDQQFHPLHSDMNTAFLYYLANTLHRNGGDQTLCTKIFYLNKALNGFHCLYDAELPDIFFIAHSVGIVLGRLRYPRYLVLCQGTTIGMNKGEKPVLEEGIILYPGSSIAGRCRVGARTVLAINTAIVDRDSPGDCIVSSDGGELAFRTPKRDLFTDYFTEKIPRA
jgi:serine O-acetyltransferase